MWIFSMILALLIGTAAAQAQSVMNYGKAVAEPSRPPNFDAIGIDQRRGQQVPLDLVFRDHENKEVTLGGCVGGKPTILVLAYYKCPMLCNQVLNGVVESLRNIRPSIGFDFNVVTVSFDPKDKPGIAWAKKDSYVHDYGRVGAENGWYFLTGEKTAIDALCQAVGFRYEYDEQKKQFNHASGIMILTPFGKLSKYFYGISYHDPKNDPSDPDTDKQLETAIREASKGMIGSEVEPGDVMKFLCYDYNPITGEYSLSIMKGLRIIFGALVLVLAVWLIRVWRRPAAKIPALPETNERPI